MIFSAPFLFGLMAVAVTAALAFAISLQRHDNTIADLFWGPFQLVLAFTVIVCRDLPLMFAHWILVFALTSWALRLSFHLWKRRKDSDKEDWRYAKMREQWGKTAPIHSFFKIFLLQGFFAWVLGWPVMTALMRASWTWGPFQVIGFALFAAGLIWEAIGDAQLKSFKDRASGDAILTTGLWQYTRHPNYTGEIAIWWGIFLFTQSWQESWSTLISPLFITIMIARVSGVAMIKERYKDHPEYMNYMKKTPALIPKFLLPSHWMGAEGTNVSGS